MKQNFDLHSHSNTSDGSFSPTELVEYAKKNGVTTIALTDHDTINGVEEAIKAGKEFGVTVLAGVEISIDFDPGTMHICGYNIDIKNKNLNDKLGFVQYARKNRNNIIIEKLNAMGIEITLDEVKKVAGPDQIGRPHFARVMMEKGYVTTVKEAFNKYLAKGAPCYVDRIRLSMSDAVEMIKGAGGKAVLAHPIQLKLESDEAYRKKFAELKEVGIEGVEAFSSYHTEEENKKFKSMAEEFGFIVTGGSDFHGKTKPEVELGVFGKNVDLNIDELLKLLL
ncbi:MAG: PHP domain-containing protein [Chitinispirillaceae bacterium]|nr:PHP domain-containing protein [Chitinispirillaceae bacterium]